MSDDPEFWFDKGVTDGLPVVPPTRERVERMLAATAQDRDALVGGMLPNYGRVTVEKAAVDAVMAGCRPEYLPVLLAAVECACERSLRRIRSGYRANAPVGRALRLLMINVGGAKPGETSMSTFGHPGRYTYCIAENEEASPWPAYHASRTARAPGRSDGRWPVSGTANTPCPTQKKSPDESR